MGKKNKVKKKKMEKLAIKIQGLIEDTQEEIKKFLNKNNAAGTRVRKNSMEIQRINKEMRNEVTRIRNVRAEKKENSSIDSKKKKKNKSKKKKKDK